MKDGHKGTGINLGERGNTAGAGARQREGSGARWVPRAEPGEAGGTWQEKVTQSAGASPCRQGLPRG